jgi:outer membrane protein OmpA-like peptidoglycan-associated protein
MKNTATLFLLAWAFAAAAQPPTNLQPTMTDALLTVNVTDMKDNPREGEAITFESTKTKKQYSGVTKTDGKFYLLVPKGDTYRVMYKAFTDEMDYTTFDMPLAKDTLLSFEFQLKYDLPKTYTLDNVYFDTGKSTLRPESFKEIDELAEFLLLKKGMVIEIAGHTDNVGKPEANLKLSQDRADAVRNYLIKKGVAADHVQAKGYGDTQPVGNNDTDAGRQRNRRTEVRVLKEK